MAKVLRLERRRLDVDQLQLGMFVCELDCPWESTDFMFQGFLLDDRTTLEAVRERCRHVYVDDFRQVEMPAAPVVPTVQSDMPTVPLRDEIVPAERSHARSAALVEDVFAAVRIGRGIDARACREVVQQSLDSLLRNESALLWLSRIRSVDAYTSQHCLAVSVMAMGFGRHLGLERAALEELGIAGLLHDVGKIGLDQSILNKPGRLEPDEFEHVKSHAQLGYWMLRGSAGVAVAVLDAAHGHHERLDGRGYPQGLDEAQISQPTRIISIVDCFDAITSHRVYDAARTVKEAFQILMDLRGSHFDASLVVRFIEWLGIFPVGTLVELHTGEVALVLEKHPRWQLRPKVVVLLDEQGRRCTPRLIDLAKVSADGLSQPYRITVGLADGERGLSMADPQLQALLASRELLAELEDLPISNDPAQGQR